MIPTMILFGLAFGRWWRTAVVVGALGWPLVLIATDVMDVEPGLLGAAVLGMINTGLGVLVHQGAAKALGRLRHPRTLARNL